MLITRHSVISRGVNVNPTPLGAYLKRAREAKDISQEYLGELIGKDQVYVSQIERGRNRRPPQDMLAMLADILEVPLEMLFRLAGWRVIVGDELVVTVRGVIPADSVRWTSGEGSILAEVRVLLEDLGDARDPYGLEVSGDCMRSIGILSGDVVIVQPANGREPHDGQLVVVRVGDEFSLKRFRPRDGGIELEDGTGAVVYRLAPSDDFEVIAFYVTFRPLAPR